MIVDPETGMPVSLSSTAQNLDPSSTTGALGIDLAQSQGIRSGPLLGVLEHLPSASSTSGWNAIRGGNTIMRGGYSRLGMAGREGVGQSIRQGVAGFGTNPRGFSRFASSANIDPFPYDGGKATYSPFNVLSKSANWATNKAVSTAFSGSGGMVNRALSGTRGLKYASRAVDSGILDFELANRGYKQEFWSKGMLARGNAASRLYARGGSATGSLIGNVDSFLGSTNKGLQAAARQAGWVGPGGSATSSQLADLTLGSARGTISQYVGGYARGAKFGALSSADADVLLKGGSKAFVRGAESAAARLSAHGLENVGGRLVGKAGTSMAGKIGARAGMSALAEAGATRAGAKLAVTLGSRAALGAIPVAGQIAMAAWMAYDVAQMGISAMTGAADFVKDAGKSMKGSIDKPVMGMGYQDTTVAATSRARGVQAIANSRLNARSVLGSEGAMLASHFG